MPAAGAYVILDGQTYRVLDQTLDDVQKAIDEALQKGSVLRLEVAAAHNLAEGMGSGTLYLHGGQLPSVAVLPGPLPSKGQPGGY